MQVCKFAVQLHPGPFGQVEHGAQRVPSASRLQGVVVEAVGLLLFILFGDAAQAVKPAPAFFSATVGHGKGQWHVFLIRGGQVGSRLLYGSYKLLQ